ncbi:MAG TPA: hypothetical protein VHG52_14935 [Thermomicrobiales bacterium]|nr:hypothetical protein [Thermomicrobiales bacterium]
MRRPATLVVLSLVVLTAVSGAALTSPVQTAEAQALHHVYLPWVPSSGSTNGIGPWHGNVSLHNLTDDQCAVAIRIGGASDWATHAQLSLRGGSSRTISAESLAIPQPGAPVRLEAFCPIAASVKEVSPAARVTPWSNGASVVTGYSAVAEADLSAAGANGNTGWFLPIVQTNSGWNTVIRVSNFHDTESVTAQVELYPSGNQLGGAGVSRTISLSIPPGGHVGINALNELGTFDWVGYASVMANGPVGILAHRSKPSANMALTNVAVAGDRNSTEQRSIAPLLFSAYNGWNTGINLANISDRPANVTVSYFAEGGGFIREETLTMAARSMEYLYTPGNVEQDEFVGSATIESDAPVVAAIDEVKYDTTEAMSYLASPVAQTSAAIPITFREDPEAGFHDNSGINIANLNPGSPQDVEVVRYSGIGDPILAEPIIVTLPPGGNEFVYLPFIEGLPAGTVASARLRTADPLGFVAVSNNVNYAVSGDGSVVFGAVSESGLYHLSGDSVGE